MLRVAASHVADTVEFVAAGPLTDTTAAAGPGLERRGRFRCGLLL